MKTCANCGGQEQPERCVYCKVGNPPSMWCPYDDKAEKPETEKEGDEET